MNDLEISIILRMVEILLKENRKLADENKKLDEENRRLTELTLGPLPSLDEVEALCPECNGDKWVFTNYHDVPGEPCPSCQPRFVEVLTAEIYSGNKLDGDAFDSYPKWLDNAISKQRIRFDNDAHFTSDYAQWIVETPEGQAKALAGDIIYCDCLGLHVQKANAMDKILLRKHNDKLR
jgi:hypothetical protein